MTHIELLTTEELDMIIEALEERQKIYSRLRLHGGYTRCRLLIERFQKRLKFDKQHENI